MNAYKTFPCFYSGDVNVYTPPVKQTDDGVNIAYFPVNTKKPGVDVTSWFGKRGSHFVKSIDAAVNAGFLPVNQIAAGADIASVPFKPINLGVNAAFWFEKNGSHFVKSTGTGVSIDSFPVKFRKQKPVIRQAAHITPPRSLEKLWTARRSVEVKRKRRETCHPESGRPQCKPAMPYRAF
ncbi:MAG: hypothetical protein GY950_24015 [bacterium]|nr:hypothetical protein [bacterium]